MASPFKKYVVDLFGEKQKFTDAAIKNIQLSNEMSGRFQTLVATVILAQLAFLGTLGFENNQKILAASAATTLAIALTVHLAAGSWQQARVINSIKHYIKKVGEVEAIIKQTKKTHISPEEYEKYRIIETSSTIGYTKWPNRLLMLGYILAFAGTALVLLLIWRLVA
ncbi:MAG TPA: hypothetical protein PL051_02250 [Candidatus Saccharibacteria bacterium]|nr:hypothetical protein [Candidatus Saccharibacteria bacterium]